MHACQPHAPGAGGRSPSPSICTRCPVGCLGRTTSPASTPWGTRLLPSAGRLTGLGEGGACRLRDTARGGQGCERSLSTHLHSSGRESPVPKDSIYVLPGFAWLFSESPDPNSCHWALSLPMRLRQLIYRGFKSDSVGSETLLELPTASCCGASHVPKQKTSRQWSDVEEMERTTQDNLLWCCCWRRDSARPRVMACFEGNR